MLQGSSLLPSALYPKQRRNFCKYSAALQRESASQAYPQAQLGLNLLSFFSCVTLEWLSWLRWKSFGSALAGILPVRPPHAPRCSCYLCTLTHPCRCSSKSTRLHVGWGASARFSRPLFTYACKHTHSQVHTSSPFLLHTFTHIHRPFWKLLFSARFYL